MFPNWAVIIPAFNEERFLPDCLSALGAATGGTVPIVVADNGSQDNTVEIARSFADRLPITVLVRPAIPVAALRNEGARVCAADVLAFVDADCVVPEDWYRRANELIADRAAGVIGAYYAVAANAPWPARAWYADNFRRSGNVAYIPSSNMIVRSEVFWSVGGFDEKLRSNEDCDLCARIRRSGLDIRAYPELAVIHLGIERTVGEFFRRQLWHGSSVFAVGLRDFPRITNRNAIAFALVFLVAMLGTAGWAIIHHALWPVIFPLTLLLLPVLMAARKSRALGTRFIQLTLLFFIYGLARALCLVGFGRQHSPLKDLRATSSSI